MNTNDSELISEECSENCSVSEKQINKYNEWKSNSPLLYDILISFNLENIPLSIQIGDIIEKNELFTTNEIYIGMTDNKSEESGILVKNISYPTLDFFKQEDSEKKDKNYHNNLLKNFKIKCKENKNKVLKKIQHNGDVNRMKINQNNSNIIATKSSDSKIYIINTQSSESLLSLNDHSNEGYGISWSKENKLLSGSYDKKVVMYQIDNYKNGNLIFESNDHNDVVEDVGFNKFNENIFASVGDDKKLIV